jgi:Flp pilus assembly protein TadD
MKASCRSLLPRLALIFVLALSGRPARAAEPQWVEVRSPHFTVLTDAGEKQGREVALRFEQMRNVYGTLLQRARINMPVPLEVLAFRGSKEMKQGLPLWKGKPVEAAGYYQPGSDRDYILVDLSATNVWHVVFHEYAHLLLRGNYPATAPWFDEGFAEYYATVDITAKSVEVGKMPEGDDDILLHDTRMSLVDLFSVGRDSPAYNESGSKRSMFYAQSWLVVHYLIDMKKLPQAGQYFDLVQNQHRPVPDAIRQAFGMEPKQLDKLVNDYSHSDKVVAYTFALPSIMSNGDYKARKLGDMEARAAVADMKLHTRDHFDEGVAELEAILQQKPDLASAHRGLGYAYLHKGDFRRAGEHFKQAADLDPQDPRVLYYAALLINRESLAGGSSSTDAGEMKQKLDTALGIDPDFADAWNLLAFADMMLQDPRGALDALKKAIQLSPREERYQLNLGIFYLQQRRWDDAAGILEHLKDSSNPEIAEQAAQNLALLDEAKAGRAPVQPADRSRYPTSYDAPQWQPQPGQAPPDVTKPIVKNEDTQPDTRPIQYLKGRLVRVECSSGPEAILHIAVGPKVRSFRAADRNQLVLVGTDTFSCEWHDLPVFINYRAGGHADGDLVSLELQ